MENIAFEEVRAFYISKGRRFRFEKFYSYLYLNKEILSEEYYDLFNYYRDTVALYVRRYDGISSEEEFNERMEIIANERFSFRDKKNLRWIKNYIILENKMLKEDKITPFIPE